jgi:hypothetical protein
MNKAYVNPATVGANNAVNAMQVSNEVQLNDNDAVKVSQCFDMLMQSYLQRETVRRKAQDTEKK